MEGISLGSAFLRLYGDRSALDRELETLKRYTDQLEKQGIRVKFDADTGQATREIDQLQNRLNGLNQILAAVGQGLQGDGNAFQALGESLSNLSSRLGASGGALGGFSGALSGAMGAASRALPVLAQIGLAAQGLQAIFFGVSAAVNSVLKPLEQLSQQAGRFNQQVAEAGIFTSQSFGILGPDGKAIEGTANQMSAVRGVITKEYKEIQKEVAKISGATASEIYEGFNLILQNSTALGKEGESLGNIRKLSTRLAAATNVLGVPGDQYRSEVSSLLTGDVQMYDQLANKLYGSGARDKIQQLQEEGKYYEDLMQKLEKLFEGQEVLSASLSNVQSNFEDVFQTINTEGGQALERGLAGGLQAVLDSLDTLQGSFAGAMRGITEAMEPLLRMLGEIGGWLVSLGSMIASLVQIVGDVGAVGMNLVGLGMLPLFRALGGILQVIAKVFELLAAAISTALRPLSTFFRVLTGQAVDGVDSFFDGILKFFDDLIAKAEGAAATVARPFVEMAKGVAWLQGKLQGMTPEEIAQRQSVVEAEFATALGGAKEPELRALNLSKSTKDLLEERAARLGSGSTRRLNEAKELSQLVQDRVKNEIQGLEQALRLMGAQKSLQQSMNELAESRRGLETNRANFAIQVAASPEARLAADEARNDLALRQEQQRIQERRALLGTEREMLQTQLQIQLKQQKLQQEQLRIQRLELQIQKEKAQAAVADITTRMQAVRAGSTEFKSMARQRGEAQAELRLRSQQLEIVDRTVELGNEMVGVIQQTNTLEGRTLDIKGQQLGIQEQLAGATREQQAQLADLQRKEQAITAERDKRLEQGKEETRYAEQQLRSLEKRLQDSQELEKADRARLELQQAQAAAAVQEAEAQLKVAQAQQNATDSPTSVQAVIGARIEALAAGVQGFASEADATRKVYEARQRQLQQEQELQRKQLQVQQERERTELQLAAVRLNIEGLRAQNSQVELEAQREQLKLQKQRDQISAQVAATVGTAAGYPAAPVLPAPAGAVQGGIANMLPGTKGGPNINEGVGWSAWRGRNHNGQDLGLDVGDPIHARRAGVVQQAYPSGFGKVGGAVVIRYDDGTTGTYGHVLPSVREGQQIGAGQRIATVAPDGQNTHLHYELRSALGELLNPLRAIQASLRVPGGRVMAGTAGTAALPPAQQTAGVNTAAQAAAQATSLQNSIDSNANSIRDNAALIQRTTEALERLNNVLIPGLVQTQSLQAETLTTSQRAKTEELRIQAIRDQLTAEVLNTPRGRLAGQLTEATAGSLGNTMRGLLGQLFSSEGFDLVGLTESITRTMAERFTGALLDAALAPIEKQLTETLFRTFSGVDVEEQARALAQEQAAGSLTTAGVTLQQAGTALGQAATALAGGSGTGVPSFDQIWGAAGGPALVPLAESSAGLSQSMDAAAQTIDVVATTAGRTAGGFEGLMQNLGRVGAVLGGIAMGVGGAQQMSGGGTYNTLMGLAGVFGSIGSLTGMFAGPRAAASAGSNALAGFTSPGLDFGIQPGISSPVAFPQRAYGGPVTTNQAYLVGERGPELFVPTTAGTVLPHERTQALLSARGALSRSASPQAPGNSLSGDAGVGPVGNAPVFTASREAVAAVSLASREQQAERVLALALDAPARPLDVRFESRVINGIEYVTAEQFQQGLRDAAERGRAMTLKDMRNSVKVRKSLGMG